MPPRLNLALAWIATVAGVTEILSWLPRTALILVAVLATAIATWALLYRFGIRQRRIDTAAMHRRRELGY